MLICNLYEMTGKKQGDQLLKHIRIHIRFRRECDGEQLQSNSLEHIIFELINILIDSLPIIDDETVNKFFCPMKNNSSRHNLIKSVFPLCA